MKIKSPFIVHKGWLEKSGSWKSIHFKMGKIEKNWPNECSGKLETVKLALFSNLNTM